MQRWNKPFGGVIESWWGERYSRIEQSERQGCVAATTARQYTDMRHEQGVSATRFYTGRYAATSATSWRRRSAQAAPITKRGRKRILPLAQKSSTR
jgi:hypothetical protein